MGLRSNWYQDEPGGRFNVPPFRSWSGTALLIVVLTVAFFCQLVFGAGKYLALHVDLVKNPLCWYQFLTYALAHSESDVWHLVMNCVVIYFFGRTVEVDLGGRRPFLLFCAAAAVLSSLSFVVIEAFRGVPGVTLVGASGIAFACVVGFATLRPMAQVILLIVPMRAWALATIFMTIELFYFLTRTWDGVAHISHLAGGGFGFLYFRYRHTLDLVLFRFRQRRASAELQRRVDRKQELDRLLEKISKSGIGSLSRSERRFLDSASRDMRNRR